MKYFIYALSLLFVGLKLTGYINWSWLVVFSPILFLWFVIFVATFVLTWAEEKEKQRRRHSLGLGAKSKFQQRMEEYMKAGKS